MCIILTYSTLIKSSEGDGLGVGSTDSTMILVSPCFGIVNARMVGGILTLAMVRRDMLTVWRRWLRPRNGVACVNMRDVGFYSRIYVLCLFIGAIS